MENIVVIFVLYDIRCPMITKTIENKYCTQKEKHLLSKTVEILDRRAFDRKREICANRRVNSVKGLLLYLSLAPININQLIAKEFSFRPIESYKFF